MHCLEKHTSCRARAKGRSSPSRSSKRWTRSNSPTCAIVVEDMKVIAHASLAALVALFAVSGAVNAEEAERSIDFDGETHEHEHHAGGAVLILDESLRTSDTHDACGRTARLESNSE